MKSVIATVALVFATGVMAQPAKNGEPVYAKTTPNPVVEPAKNDNCVKKDKQGKCPPLPKSEKPTPKKKAESK